MFCQRGSEFFLLALCVWGRSGGGGRFRHDGRSGFGLNEGTILDLAYE